MSDEPWKFFTYTAELTQKMTNLRGELKQM